MKPNQTGTEGPDLLVVEPAAQQLVLGGVGAELEASMDHLGEVEHPIQVLRRFCRASNPCRGRAGDQSSAGHRAAAASRL